MEAGKEDDASAKSGNCNVGVFYSTKSGNTRKVAEAIAESAGVCAQDVSALGGEFSIKEYGMVFVGSGSYGSAPSPQMEEFIKGLADFEGKCAAVFGTSGGGREDYLEKMKGLLEGRGVRVLGTWGCLGQEYSLKNEGKPDKGDLEAAREFAGKMMGEAGIP